MDISKFKGTGVAVVTPFRADGSIDFNALKRIINFQIDNGVNFLVVLGTTGEPATLNKDENQAVIDFIIEENDKRVPLVVGCGGNNTAELINYIHKLEKKQGIDALLSVAPYYNKPNQTGIFEHFKALSNSTKLPIILYNVPGRTASNISAETTLKLANSFDNIIGIKEASGNFTQMMQIVKNRPNNFLVLSGDDGTALPLISLGFDGVISVVANAYPKEFSTMIDLSLQGKFEDARDIHYSLIDIINTMFEEGNPAGVKAYMNYLKLIDNTLRLPLVPVSKELNSRIEVLANKLK
jgi:4-hydroxy-tetrahydrodipicolinate synthase